MHLKSEKSDFINRVLSNKWTIAETAKIIQNEYTIRGGAFSENLEISNITFKDFLDHNYNEIILEIPEECELLNWCSIIIDTYSKTKIKDCGQHVIKNTKVTLANIVSYYIKNVKFQKLEQENLQKYLNSKTVEEHISEYETKIKNCKNAKELILLLIEGGFTPNDLHRCGDDYDFLEDRDFLNLHDKENVSDEDRQRIDEYRNQILIDLNFETKIENYTSEVGMVIAIFIFKNHNIKLGAIGYLNSEEYIESEKGFVEIKLVEKIMQIWELVK